MTASAKANRGSVAVVGMGASGTLVAIRLCETAVRRQMPIEIMLIDSASEVGRGTAYATSDSRHLLNAPAKQMSCYPNDSLHFVRWLRSRGEHTITGTSFVSRYDYGTYLADTLGRAITSARGIVSFQRLRHRVAKCRYSGVIARLELNNGTVVEANSVVLATGPIPPSFAWLPTVLHGNDRFIADPWAPGSLQAPVEERSPTDVLLIGTGLTAVDVALLLDRPGRTVHALSRSGRLPQAHAVSPLPAIACPEPLLGTPLPNLRAAVRRHITRAIRTQGDWRPALDGLRPLTPVLWSSFTNEERAEFLEHDESLWNVHRHRMPPPTAEMVTRMRRTRRLRIATGRIDDAALMPNGTFTVSLADGRELSVGWVVNCTGPTLSVADSDDPLWQSLLRRGDAVPGPLGIGVSTEDGMLRDKYGRSRRGLWTLGSPRRGELWETTAIPEIRAQAEAVAEAILDHFAAQEGSPPSVVGGGLRPSDIPLKRVGGTPPPSLVVTCTSGAQSSSEPQKGTAISEVNQEGSHLAWSDRGSRLPLPAVGASPSQGDGNPGERPRRGEACPSAAPAFCSPQSRVTGATVWMTGLPGAGKRNIAIEVAGRLQAEGKRVEILDEETVRAFLSDGLGFCREERNASVRRIGMAAEVLARNGVIVLVPVAAPYWSAREAIRLRHGLGHIPYFEIHVASPVEVCSVRDVKGLYAKQAAGELTGLTGVDDPYEEPAAPDLRIESQHQTVQESAASVYALLSERGLA